MPRPGEKRDPRTYNPNNYVPRKQVAELLGIKQTRVTPLMDAGLIPSRILHGMRFTPYLAFCCFMMERQLTPHPEPFPHPRYKALPWEDWRAKGWTRDDELRRAIRYAEEQDKERKKKVVTTYLRKMATH